jgi:cell division protein FtsQ
LQQVGPGPGLWWRADQPPAPPSALEAPAPRGGHSPSPTDGLRRRIAAVALGGAALLVLAQPDARTAAVAGVERAAEWAGLGLQRITVSGHRFTENRDVLAALDLGKARTLLSFDVRGAQARLELLPWIERASIDLIVPDAIDVRITERKAAAVLRAGERSWLIDRAGRKLQAVPANVMPELLRVAGGGAAQEAAALSAILAAFPQIARKVELAERVGTRRWTLHLAGGPSVQLPADAGAEALARLARLLDAGLKDVKNIDLRVSTRVLVREHRDGAGPPDEGSGAPADRT